MRARTGAGAAEATEAQARTAVTALVVHPQVARLRGQCEALAGELAQLVFAYDQLRCVVAPNLEAQYMLKVGRYAYELFCTQLQVRRLRRTIALLQAAANRRQAVDPQAVEAQLALEYAASEAQAQQMAAQLHAAREQQANLLSNEESAELHRLYRGLARRLHPDVNPGSSAHERRLWQWAKDAYAAGNLADLRLLAAMLGPEEKTAAFPLPNGQGILEQWRERRQALAAHVAGQRLRIEDFEQQFPCNLRAQLSDRAWVAEQRAQHLADLGAAQALLTQYQAIAADLWAGLGHAATAGGQNEQQLPA